MSVVTVQTVLGHVTPCCPSEHGPQCCVPGLIVAQAQWLMSRSRAYVVSKLGPWMSKSSLYSWCLWTSPFP